MRPLRNTDREDARCGSRHLVLSSVPDRDRSLGRKLVVEPTLTLEAVELRVPADRPSVDHDLRHRPAACQLVQPAAKGWILVEHNLVELDALALQQSLRPRAVAAPPRRIDLNSGHPADVTE